MHELRCSEVWGGIRNEDVDACSAALTTSLYSAACDGGKGGDIYYVSVCGHDRLTRIAVADVVGHGQRVSSVSQWLYGSLQSHMNSLDNAGVLADLNREVVTRGFDALTTAAVVTVFEADHLARFSYAGHPPVLLRSRAGGNWASVPLMADGVETANLPLGVDPDVAYLERHVQVCPGDRLVLYTDGVIEAPDAHGTQFGPERLCAALAQAGDGGPRELKSAVLAALHDHAGANLSHDDVTILAVEVR